MFNEASKKFFTISFDSWTTDRKPVNTGKSFQLKLGSSADITASSYLIAAHEKKTVKTQPKISQTKDLYWPFSILSVVENTL